MLAWQSIEREAQLRMIESASNAHPGDGIHRCPLRQQIHQALDSGEFSLHSGAMDTSEDGAGPS